MNPYELLRKQAAEKLDQAVSAARKEYRETCDKINALRKELGDEPEPGVRVHKTTIDTVREYLPRDRTFSNADVLSIVQDVEPERHWNRGTVKAAVYRLADLKEIRRIAKDDTGHVLWAAFDFECESKPYADMPLSDVIAEILGDKGAMRPAELVVAAQALGCRAEDDPGKLLRAVRKALQGNPRRFERDGEGRWCTGS
ncbi:MAG: hypothetical protein KDA57_09035 [Planctomycetales bacterium]|nr:hypothetical protein [Planctomycetales bacterium]